MRFLALYSSIQSDRIQSLIPRNNLINRTCTLKMADYRYFFNDLKGELEKLIANLVEVWIATGYGKGISEGVIDSLLANKTW